MTCKLSWPLSDLFQIWHERQNLRGGPPLVWRRHHGRQGLLPRRPRPRQTRLGQRQRRRPGRLQVQGGLQEGTHQNIWYQFGYCWWVYFAHKTPKSDFRKVNTKASQFFPVSFINPEVEIQKWKRVFFYYSRKYLGDTLGKKWKEGYARKTFFQWRAKVG